MHGPRRLAIFNHKGGTGKTTTTVSIAAGLAQRGLKVLLVDTDSQGNVGVSLGVKAERSLYHVLVMGLKAQDAAINIRPNLDFIASNETLAAAELYLARNQPNDGLQALSKLQVCFQANPKDLDTLGLLARAFNAIGQAAKGVEVQKEMARIAKEQGKTELFKQLVENPMGMLV